VSKLPTGFLPYEKYFLCTQELEEVGIQDKALYETYLELMCHFHIYLDAHNIRGNVNGLKRWEDYLFPSLESVPEEIYAPVADTDIEAMLTVNRYGDVILEEDDEIY